MRVKIVSNKIPNGGYYVGKEGEFLPELSTPRWLAVRFEERNEVVDFLKDEIEFLNEEEKV